MSLNPILAGRRSVRAFAPRPVSGEDLAALVEAVRWSPSSGNSQPWRILARSSSEARAALSAGLSRGNQWALKAPLLLTLVTRMDWDTTSNDLNYALFDCGLAAMSLTVEAETRGLRVHQMAGWRLEPLSRTLELPQGVTPVVVIAVGYPGDIDQLDPELQVKERRPRARKLPSDIFCEDTWPETWGKDEEFS